LKDCCARPDYGYTTSASTEPVGPKFLRITDIQDGKVDWKKVPYAGLANHTSDTSRLEAGDIVIARIGATTGKAFLIGECPEAVFASYLIRVRTKPNTSPEFLSFFFQSADYWNQIDQRKGGRLKGGVNIPNLESLSLFLPPLAEQRAIAHVLQTVQDAREARQRELALERERKTALMEHLFTHGVRDEATKQSEIGEIPESWRVASLSEVAKISSGGTPDRSKPEYWGGTIPWVRTGEIRYNTIVSTEERITQEGLENSAARILPAGTLLMAMYGQGVTRGKVAILGIDAAINQACAAITPRGADLSPRFAFHYLQFAYESIRVLGHGANQKNMNSHLVGSILVPLPPTAEQEKISDVLTAIDAKVNSVGYENGLLGELFNALLKELMTGQVGVGGLIAGGSNE
jgi:type I restriction enzyme S subunit